MSYIYIVCPVRQCTAEEYEGVKKYVTELESKGHFVHFPPRDVDH